MTRQMSAPRTCGLVSDHMQVAENNGFMDLGQGGYVDAFPAILLPSRVSYLLILLPVRDKKQKRESSCPPSSFAVSIFWNSTAC